ncbi:MAG TPA: NAD(P)-binding protein [Solirubrobacteraceae bacterium]|nr:NAD(P)-binding protein [Solirubrobacteraceae bacterium]
MARIVVLGAGVCGLAAGMLLRRDGHEVTVLERDPAPVPESGEEAWESWARDGVSQFRLPHLMLARARLVLEEALPDVYGSLEAAGATRFDWVSAMPPSISDRTPREEDERLWTMTARRPVFEQVLGTAADAEPGLEVRRGVAVRELVMGAYDGVPHVSGVRTSSGEELRADLVIDAMGRRSQLPRWLEAAGTRPVHEEAEDSGFIYYGRHFRARDGHLPDLRAPAVTRVGTFSILTLPADNATWSVTLVTSAGDRPLKRLRDLDAWTAVLSACPRHVHWLDGEPLTGVQAMGGVLDRYRRFSVDGKPVATGVAAAGDSWACSNPTLGRGIALGLWHVCLLREVVREHLGDPREFAEAWDEVTETELAPWYRETVEEDRARVAEIEALRSGSAPPPAPSGSWLALMPALFGALVVDPDVFRAFMASRACLTRLGETFADEGFVTRVLELARDSEPPPLPGPDRAQLLALLEDVPAAA